jgi:hypothetical protein
MACKRGLRIKYVDMGLEQVTLIPVLYFWHGVWDYFPEHQSPEIEK